MEHCQKEILQVKDTPDKRVEKTIELKKHLEKYKQENIYFGMKLNFQEYLFEKEYLKRVVQEEKTQQTASDLVLVKSELSKAPIIKIELKEKIEKLENQLLCVMQRFKEIEKEVIDLKESEHYLKDEISIFITENREYENKLRKLKAESNHRYLRDEEMLQDLNDLAASVKDNANAIVILDLLKFKVEESLIEFIS